MRQIISGENWEAWRILDANANRASEGLRTLDDYARLGREDAIASAWLKELRHRFTQCVNNLHRLKRIGSRSAENDAGTELSNETETQRTDVTAVIPPAVERVTQALRQLEEFSKVVAPETANQFKELRYVAYDVLAKIELRWASLAARFEKTHLYLLIDCSRPESEFCEYVGRLSEAGVDWFQIRDKHADASKLVRYSKIISDVGDSDSSLIVNDRVDIAMACNAAAVHLGQDDLSLEAARKLVGQSRAVGISTHDVEQAKAAEQGGADYIGCGPTFPSETKTFDSFVGTDLIREVGQRLAIPAFAIGGINLQNLDQLIAVGCNRVAVSNVIHAAPDPFETAKRLKETLAGGV